MTRQEPLFSGVCGRWSFRRWMKLCALKLKAQPGEDQETGGSRKIVNSVAKDVDMQERPYTSRPSRTQQLLNPELAPKISEATSKDRGRRNDANQISLEKRPQSASAYRSVSVSTISTDDSRSRSRQASTTKSRRNVSTSPRPRANRRPTSTDRSRSPDLSQSRRRRSPVRSRSHKSVHTAGKAYHERSIDDDSALRDRADESRRYGQVGQFSSMRKRSPSPFSARLALTQAIKDGQ
nr:hypothetical protein CFP56_43837 [Quercus suber]